MAKNTITCEIDKQLSMQIATQVLHLVDKMPAEAASTILNGIAIALMSAAADTAKIATEKGMVEKMVLSWFPTCDQLKGTQFAKYINLEGN